jgi:hypothetical protein
MNKPVVLATATSVALAITLVSLSGCAHKVSHAHPTTVSLQSPMPTCADGLVRGFYDITLSAFANGAAHVDLPSYEAESFAYFRANAAQMRADPEQLVAHLKDIPRQLVQIVKEDSSVLDQCESFMLALHGPP